MIHLHRQLGMLAGIAALFAISAALSSCNQQPPPPASPPPPVTIAKPVEKDIVEWDEYTGRTDAVENVNITPRVSGYIDNVTFRAGDLVNKGDLLFVIDPRPYQATLDQASAQQRQAEANQQLQEANFARPMRVAPGDALNGPHLLDQISHDLIIGGHGLAAALVVELAAVIIGRVV